MLRRLERDEQRSSVKMSEALNCDNRLEVCKMQHTTSHQVRSLKKSILHHLLGSFERVEQRSSVKKLSKLWVLRSFSKFAKCSTPLSSIKIIQKVHLTPHDRSFERDEQSSWVKKFSKLWILRTSTQPVIKQDLLESASYATFLKFANSNTQLVIKQDLSKSLSHTTCWEVSKGMSSTHRSKSSRCYEFWEPSWTIAKCSTNQSSSKIL